MDRNAIFISGTGDHYIDSMYGTVTFAYGDLGLTVTMPRKWSHLDYGHYTDDTPEPEPEPDPEPGKITITKTVNGACGSGTGSRTLRGRPATKATATTSAATTRTG